MQDSINLHPWFWRRYTFLTDIGINKTRKIFVMTPAYYCKVIVVVPKILFGSGSWKNPQRQLLSWYDYPDCKVHGANMGPNWVLSAPAGPMLVPWTLLSG